MYNYINIIKQYIDPVLLRPGRFDRIIEIPLPISTVRYDILIDNINKMNCDNTIDIIKLSVETDGFSCADLINLCQLAGIDAIKNNNDV